MFMLAEPNPFPPYTPPVHDLLDSFADFALLGAGIACLVFVISYALFFNWRKTRAGAAIFYLLSSLVLVLFHVIITKVTGGLNFPGRSAIRFIVYVLPFIAGIRIVYVLWWNYFHSSKLLDLQRRPHTSPTGTKITLVDGENTTPRRYTKH